MIKLVSTVIAACAVPIFFFFSGYLFFFKIDNLSTEIYKKKLKSRIRTLLIPYLFWTLFGVVVYGILANLPYTRQIFGNGNFEFSWRYIGEQITGLKLVDGEHIYQMGYHLWFLRDLLLMVIISPLFYIAVRNRRIAMSVFFVILWCAGPVLCNIEINTTGIVFFGLGACYGVNKINFIENFSQISAISYILYPCLVFADWAMLRRDSLYTLPEVWSGMLHATMILTALPFWCNVTAVMVKKNMIGNVDWLASASFFVYLIHIPFILPQVKKILYHLVNPQSQEMLVLLYFTTIFGAIAVSLFLYWSMQRLCPKFVKIITGGR